jgi:hypothetical protein
MYLTFKYLISVVKYTQSDLACSFSNWLLTIIKDIPSRANMYSLKKYREKDDISRDFQRR